MLGCLVGLKRIRGFQGAYFVNCELSPPIGNPEKLLINLFYDLHLVLGRRILPDLSAEC